MSNKRNRRNNVTETLLDNDFNFYQEETEVVVQHKEPQIGDTFHLALDKIQTDEQVRTRFDDESIRDLASSISQEGQRTPLEVAKLGTDKYLLITGERRFLALGMISAASARVTLVPMPKDEVAKIVMQLTENIQREDLGPLDLAAAFDRLKTQGLTQAEIGKSIGKSVSWVSRYTTLIGLPHYLEQLLSEGHTSDIQLVSLLRKIADYSVETAKELALKVQAGSLGRQQATDIYEAIKNQAKDPKPEQKDKPKISDINFAHYNRPRHIIKPEQFTAYVEARLSDGTKVMGVLMTDRLVAGDDDESMSWCWVRQDNNEELCVETKKLKILKIVSQ